MEVGDLVRLRKSLNYAPTNRDVLGIIMGKRVKGTKYHGSKVDFRVTEYEVSIITNNKTAWYLSGSLEIVSERRRLG